MGQHSDLEELSTYLHDALCESWSVLPLDDNRWALASPFTYGDGDGFPIIIERRGNHWALTDRGIGVDRWFYDHDDLEPGTQRLKQAQAVIESFGLRFHGQTVEYELPTGELPDAEAIAYFIRALSAIDTLPRLRTERGPQFTAVVNQKIEGYIARTRRTSPWLPRSDDTLYTVDHRLETDALPVLFVSIGTSEKAHATVALVQKLHEWDIRGRWLVTRNADAPITGVALGRLDEELVDIGEVLPLHRGDDTTLQGALRRYGVLTDA